MHLRVIDIDLPSDLDKLIIVPFADWHKDDPRCNAGYIQHTVERIAASEDTYCIANGDLVNMALKSSVSDIYSNRISPQEQLDWIINTLWPIRHKILCYTDGNHENRVWRDVGISPAKYVTNALGIADRCSDGGALVFVSFGLQAREKSRGRKMTYSIYARHGSCGGKAAGGKVNALVDFADNVDADLYVMSHVHMPFQTALQYYRVNISNRSVRPVNKLFVSTSAALDFGGYGETNGFRPSAIADMSIVLDGARRRMAARMDV